MNRFLLYCLDAQGFQFLIKYLAQIHHNRLVDFLPQVRTEYLDKRDLESWNLSVQEYTCQIKLNLESYVDVRPVDSWAPVRKSQ